MTLQRTGRNATILLAALMLLAAPAGAQTDSDSPPSFTAEELEQILAPIALYPDSLVSQILMASTYPLEVVEADRWAKSNTNLEDDALAQALEQQSWDPSVKSLVNFPEVLTMMSDKLDWMTKLGDAFIAQQSDVMSTVQRLRVRAKDAGNLQDTEQQKVVVEQESGTEVIVIESASPTVVYVPQYDPVVVYGTWPYPAYPPYHYYPPGYVAGRAALSFGIGVACGAAWGYAWGNCHWGRGDVNINVNKNANFNRNIDRSKHSNRSGSWNHDGSHRRGVSYRDQKTAQRHGKGASRNTAQARDSFRGRADSGRRDLDGGAGRGGRTSTGGANRGTAGRGDRGAAGGRGSSGSAGGRGSSGSASRTSGSRGSAFGGSGNASSTRAASSRGKSSRSSSGRSGSRGSSPSRSSGSRSRGGRSGGGGRR